MSNLKSGDQAITFDLPGVDDSQHTLGDYADKEAVAIIFSCNHCPYVIHIDEAIVIDRVVDVHIGKLRQKLGEDQARPRFIVTVRGIGYRFTESDQ